MPQPSSQEALDALFHRIQEAVGPGVRYLILIPFSDPEKEYPAVKGEACCVQHILEILKDSRLIITSSLGQGLNLNKVCDQLNPKGPSNARRH